MKIERIEKEITYTFTDEEEFEKYYSVINQLEKNGVVRVGGFGTEKVGIWNISFTFLEIENEYCEGM